MNKTTTIETELNDTNARLAKLFQMRENLEDDIETLQDGFTEGSNSLNELQEAKSKLTLLNTSIMNLKLTQTGLQTELDESLKREARRWRIETAKAIAKEVVTAHDEYLQLRNKLNESIRATGEKMVDALFRFVSKQVEMENSLAGIEPMVYLSELELPKRTTDIVSGPSPVRPSIEFAEAVSAVETFIKNRRRFEAKQQKAAAKAQADEAYWNRCQV